MDVVFNSCVLIPVYRSFVKCAGRCPVLLVVGVVLTLNMSALAQERKPDLVLRGTVTEANRETYVEVPFTVPASVVRVSVEFAYTEHEHQTTIDLGLFDGERFRGWSGGNKGSFTV